MPVINSSYTLRQFDTPSWVDRAVPDRKKLPLEQALIGAKFQFLCPDSVVTAAGQRPVHVELKMLVLLFILEGVGAESLIILGARVCCNLFPLSKACTRVTVEAGNGVLETSLPFIVQWETVLSGWLVQHFTLLLVLLQLLCLNYMLTFTALIQYYL